MALAQCVGLDVLIEQLVGVQLGTVARQADQSKTMRVVGHEASGNGPPVYWMTIDDQIELALGLPQQALHELDEHRVMKLALEDHERQGPAIGDRRDHVATKALSGRAHHRRLADRGIAGSCHMVAAQAHLVFVGALPPAAAQALELLVAGEARDFVGARRGEVGIRERRRGIEGRGDGDEQVPAALVVGVDRALVVAALRQRSPIQRLDVDLEARLAHALGDHDRGVEVGGKIARLHEDDWLAVVARLRSALAFSRSGSPRPAVPAFVSSGVPHMKKEPQNGRAFSAGAPIACRIAVWSTVCSSASRASGLSKGGCR